MNEVKKSDIELVINALKDFLDHCIKTNNFDLQKFITCMEPKFEEAGYRNSNTIGGGGMGIF